MIKSNPWHTPRLPTLNSDSPLSSTSANRLSPVQNRTSPVTLEKDGWIKMEDVSYHDDTPSPSPPPPNAAPKRRGRPPIKKEPKDPGGMVEDHSSVGSVDHDALRIVDHDALRPDLSVPAVVATRNNNIEQEVVTCICMAMGQQDKDLFPVTSVKEYPFSEVPRDVYRFKILSKDYDDEIVRRGFAYPGIRERRPAQWKNAAKVNWLNDNPIPEDAGDKDLRFLSMKLKELINIAEGLVKPSARKARASSLPPPSSSSSKRSSKKRPSEVGSYHQHASPMKKRGPDRPPVRKPIEVKSKGTSWYSSRAETLGLAAWRDRVHAELFRHMEYGRKDRYYLERAGVLLTKFENRERVSLLELAVWKFTCLSEPKKPATSYLDMVAWIKKGWRSRKREMYRSDTVGIIIKNVVAFIGSC